MKKVLFTYILFCFTWGLSAQVGVNTLNPQRLLHIDGASSAATTNPAAGAVSAAQAVDDVVFNTFGNVGVGHLSPAAKLDIKSPITSKALRIKDGTQGNLRALTSNANGTGAWSKVAGVWYAAIFNAAILPYTATGGYRQYKNFNDGFISSNTNGAVNQAQGTIKVPYSGLYRIIQSAYFSCSWRNGVYIGCASLFVNGTPVWEPTALGSAPTHGIWPTFITIRNLNKDDVLTIYAKEVSYAFSNYSNRGSLFVEFLPE